MRIRQPDSSVRIYLAVSEILPHQPSVGVGIANQNFLILIRNRGSQVAIITRELSLKSFNQRILLDRRAL
jgi:hypothetical protein